MIINSLTDCYIVFDTKNWNIKLDTLVVYYTNRCPFTDYYVNGSLWVLAQENNIPLTIIKLETMEQAQACPSPATIFSAFYNGQFLTTDMSMCVESRFAKVLQL